MTGNVDDIIHRSPSAWQPFVGNMEVHDLACHHEAVLDPGPAAQMGKVLQQRFVHPDVRQVLEIPRLVLEETGESSAAYA